MIRTTKECYTVLTQWKECPDPPPLFSKDDYGTTPSVGNKSENTNLTGLLFRKISN